MTSNKEFEDFVEENNDLILDTLKKKGYLNNYDSVEIDRLKVNLLWMITSFAIGLMISGVIFWGIYNDKFKSEANPTLQVQPAEVGLNNTVNSEVNNRYDNKFQFNLTIENINVNCNSGGCNGTA